jgi:hypothetical protein
MSLRRSRVAEASVSLDSSSRPPRERRAFIDRRVVVGRRLDPDRRQGERRASILMVAHRRRVRGERRLGHDRRRGIERRMLPDRRRGSRV